MRSHVCVCVCARVCARKCESHVEPSKRTNGLNEGLGWLVDPSCKEGVACVPIDMVYGVEAWRCCDSPKW